MATWEIRNVGDAFEALIETLQNQVILINGQGAKFMEAGDYDRAKETIDVAAEWKAYIEQVNEIKKQMPLIRIGDRKDYSGSTGGGLKRRNFGRVRHGQRTQSVKFMPHIIGILQDSGGRAATAEVFEQLLVRMADTLTELDMQPIPSTPNVIRWQTTAHNAKQLLVKSGICKENSPRGIWELSEEGLRNAKKQSAAELLQGMGSAVTEETDDDDDYDENDLASEVAQVSQQ